MILVRYHRCMISAIVARSKNNVIGIKNDLPWDLPDDRAYFRDVTRGHPVIMGRKTAESIVDRLGRGLPNRDNIVITRDDDYSLDGFVTVHTIDGALGVAGDDAMIIGGEQIYELGLPYCDRLYITDVDVELEGDAYFPAFDMNDWVLVSEKPHPADDRHKFSFTYRVYDRKK